MPIHHYNIRPAVGDPTAGAHIIHYYTFADLTAMTALNDTNLGVVVLAATDVGRVARVGTAAPFTFYVLTGHTGPTWQLLGGGGSSVTPGVYIYQPGGAAAGNVYTSFALLHTAVNAASGPKKVFIDDSLGSPQVPSGAWTINNWEFIGPLKGNLRPVLEFQEGASITSSSRWRAEGVSITSVHTTGAIQSFVGGFSNRVELKNASISGSATRHFFDLSGFSNPSLYISLEDSASLGPRTGNRTSGFPFFYVELWSSSGLVDVEAFTGTGGTLAYRFLELAFQPPQAQVNWSGGVQYVRVADTRFVSLTVKDFVFDAQQTGTTELHVGSVKLTAGTEVMGSSAAMLGGSTGAETAHLRMRRYSGASIVGGDYTTVGTLAEANPLGGQFTIPATDWYEFYLFADAGGETAVIKGLRLELLSSVSDGV